MLNWAYFPRSAKPAPLALQVVAAFEAAYPKINSSANMLPSNGVLAHVAPLLAKAGFSVETGKKKNEKVYVKGILMGRNTFEQVLTFESWPYGSTPVVVLSHREISLSPNLPKSVSVSNNAPTELVASLTERGARRIYVDGGLTIQSFFAAGLIDDITITVIPVLLGTGKPLFGPLQTDLHLVHEGTTTFEFGFVQSRYRVFRNA